MSSEESRALELLGRVPYGRLATSMRALPFVAPARHVVTGRCVLVRLHQGFGYHRACHGGVMAYEADNLATGLTSPWSVQFTGTAEAVEPVEDERAALGPEPVRVDGEPFVPVFLRITPQFVSVHVLEYAAGGSIGPAAPADFTERHSRYAA